jgi:predicted O-methyltransferase YrrM
MPYPYSLVVPELVERAHRQAEALGFPLSPTGRAIGQATPPTATTPMDGALLRALSATRPGGLVGEIGTGPGVSTAWLLAGMHSSTRLVSCDIDSRLAIAAADFFADWPNVEVIHGDWTEVLTPRGPFDLLFFDANAQAVLSDRGNWNQVVALVRVGGQIVMDDLFPVEMWPDDWKGITDHKREFCLGDPRLAGVEVRTSPTTVAIIGTRIR